MDEISGGPLRGEGPFRRTAFVRAATMAAGVAVIIVCLSFGLEGRTGLEKSLTKLLMPIGLLWLVITGWTMHLCGARRRPDAWWALGLWLAYSAAASAPLSNLLLRQLEFSEVVFRPGIDEDLDVLVVLGGGTSQGPQRAQAGCSGDRVLYAAQLLLAGHTQRLITTGSAAPGLAGPRTSPREQTVEIWKSLGIADASISTLEGLNTFQEIQSLTAHMPELAGQRVGLLTSAFHLPRAMRLARAQGLEQVIPVAADYQTNAESYAFYEYLPSVGGFNQLARWQHEWLAKLVSR